MLSSYSRSLPTTAARCLTALLFLSGVAIAANTETVTSSAQLGSASQADNIYLPSFNTLLGTLESVVVTLQFNINPEITVANSTGTSLAFSDITLTAPFNVSGPGGFTYSSSLTTWSLSGTTAANSTANFEPGTSGLSATQGINPSALSLWENQPGDLVDLVVTPGYLTTNVGSSSGLQVSGTALENENISIQYTYLTANAQAVPEPAGRYLMAITGLAMVFFVIRRHVQLMA